MESAAQGRDHAVAVPVDAESRGRRRRRDEPERDAVVVGAMIDVHVLNDILHHEELRRVREEEERRDPATVESIWALYSPVAGAGETNEEGCAICLDDFVVPGALIKQLRMMPCSHSFHQRCIFRWLQIDRRCPVCRFAMPSEKRRRLPQAAQPDDGQ